MKNKYDMFMYAIFRKKKIQVQLAHCHIIISFK